MTDTKSLQPVRGTHDLLPEAARVQRHVVHTLQTVAENYGYQEIATPLFEFTEVFARTLGETSDVVSKEMYSFSDRGGESITLRPEGTAGVARSVISNKLYDFLPLKYWYTGAMFRYERPQKGRQRQFHQVGVEFLGVSTPLADAETIALGWHFLSALQLQGNLRLEINSLGDEASRIAYRTALVAYLERYKTSLSADSQERLVRNPLRILDSKDAGDQEIIKGAPSLKDSMSAEATAYFAAVQEYLALIGIPVVVNPRLVRGLDYYSHTAFEIISDGLGAQATVLAGGRYDGLIEMMGGKPTAGIGWAAGIERLALLLPPLEALPRPVAVIAMADVQENYAFTVVQNLREQGIMAELITSGNVAKKFKKANKINALYAVLLGAEEQATGRLIVKNLDSGTQQNLSMAECITFLKGDATF
jgi:histidyl-tRNA synthetase